MKKLVCLILALALGGCSAAQQTAFNATVAATISKFNADIAAANTFIANADATLAKYCGQLVVVGGALATGAGTSTANGSALIGVDAAIVSYCTSNPQNLSQAYTAVKAAIAAGNAATASAKAGN